MRKTKLILPLIGLTVLSGTSITIVGCKSNEEIHETWGEEQAHIIDGKTVRNCTYLTTSKICALSGDITTDDGKTYTRNTFNLPVHLNPNLNRIEDSFLEECSAFNQPISFGDQLEIIGSGFLKNCRKFNHKITLPGNLWKIGQYFLRSCASFNQPLTLPTSITYVGERFMLDCDNMTSQINIQDLEPKQIQKDGLTLTTINDQAPTYKFGVEIVGEHKAEFLLKFPNSYVTPFRNLK